MNRVVLLEVVRHLLSYVKAYRHKHGTGVSFPITLGDSIEVCPSTHTAEDAEKELAFHSLNPFMPRDYFDPYDNVKEVLGKKYGH